MLMCDPVTRMRKILVMQSCTTTRKQFLRYRYRRENKTDEETLREHIANIFDEFPTLARYLSAFDPYFDKYEDEPAQKPYANVYTGMRQTG